MPQHTTIDVTCPACGAHGSFETWPAFDGGDERPAGLLKDGTLGRYVCPACGHASEVDYPCVYRDAPHGLAVRCDQTGGRVPADAGSGSGALRVVSTFDELAEKARVFADGLDDRVVEMVKVLALMRVRDEFAITGDEPVRYEGLTPNGDVRIAVLPTGEGRWHEVPIARSLYDDVARDVTQVVGVDEQGVWLRVDRAWAAAQLNQGAGL